MLTLFKCTTRQKNPTGLLKHSNSHQSTKVAKLSIAELGQSKDYCQTATRDTCSLLEFGCIVYLHTCILLGLACHQKTSPVQVQRAQNAAARVVVWGSRRRLTNSVDLLKQLHWLPVEWRIKFKIACITYKTISTTQPACLYSSLKHYTPSRTLRSSDSKLLFVPHVHTRFRSPTVWNSLLVAIHSSVYTFHSQFSAPTRKLSSITQLSGIRQASRRYSVLYKFTYLITYLKMHSEVKILPDLQTLVISAPEYPSSFSAIATSSTSGASSTSRRLISSSFFRPSTD